MSSPEEEKNGIEEEAVMADASGRSSLRSTRRRRSSRLNGLIEVRRESIKNIELYSEEQLMSPIENMEEETESSEPQSLSEPRVVKVTEKQLRRISHRLSAYHDNLGKERLVEVRLSNFCYHVPVRADTPSVPTVWNATPLYKAYRFFRRIYLYRTLRDTQARTSKFIPRSTNDIFQPYEKKTILNNINLVLKPGNSYLILGPPGCGE